MEVVAAAQLLDLAWRSSVASVGPTCTVDSSLGDELAVDAVNVIVKSEGGAGVGRMECWAKCLLRVFLM